MSKGSRAIAPLSRFLAKSGDKYSPFSRLYVKRNPTDSCGEWSALSRIGSTWPPPFVGVMSRLDKPSVYYVSKMLTGPETRYSRTEKLALALIYSARKLRPYFQAHRIVVLTDQPLKTILQKPDVSGRLVKWAIELGEFDVEFQPRPAIKAQALADFLVETAIPALDEQPTEDEETFRRNPENGCSTRRMIYGRWQ
ncbi:hypothetical protein Nepgr_006162 [Nepenthes gracilis]|uniref:Reverse transcriptase RNase H-like domain-containing protein n=1 Tax=Nepenthes gracilis TaxID=150966 RepID=A0AAD3S4M6_NEPGR|nr:hypothetical protein Nepgr_006162 [Nepenthes gracilis]